MSATTTAAPRARRGQEATESAPIEVRPDGVVPLRRPGRAPFRVLLFGGGAMVGWGLLDHERGLPGHLADGLARHSGHGIDLDVVVDLDPTRVESIALLQGLRIARYDAIVVLLGERAALDGVGRRPWEQAFQALAGALHAEASKASPVFVFDSAQPMVAVSSAGLRRRRALSGAARLADVTRRVSDGGRIRFDELAAPAFVLGWGRQFSTANLRGWADDIARTVAPALEAAALVDGPETGAAVRDRAQDERFRQRAVDSMRLSARERDGLLDGIARQAKALFRTTDAFVTIVDGDRVWQRASTRSMLGEVPRSVSLCDRTVRSDRVTLVNDLALERHLDAAPVIGGSPLAFYAGEPIHSADGYRIGALCLTDPNPRRMRPEQLGELHVLAGRIEKELWAASLGRRTP